MSNFLKSLIATAVLFSAVGAFAEPVDINTANADQLAQAMVGVGKSKAEAIVLDREKNGKYHSVDDLSRVKGIKQGLIDKNRDKIAVSGQSVTPVAEAAAK